MRKPFVFHMPPDKVRRGTIAGRNANMLKKRVAEQMNTIFDELLPSAKGKKAPHGRQENK